MKTQSLAGDWQFRQVGAAEWLPATVPGGVHTDLLALGRIPDPFVGDNEVRVAWVAEADWEYRTRFTADAELRAQPRLRLVCDGLDTLATVSLNGRVAKAGSEVREGDVMEIRFGSRLGRYEITAIRETVRKEEAALMYRVLQEDATTQQERNA